MILLSKVLFILAHFSHSVNTLFRESDSIKSQLVKSQMKEGSKLSHACKSGTVGLKNGRNVARRIDLLPRVTRIAKSTHNWPLRPNVYFHVHG